MNPNLWQNRAGSETERETSLKYEEQRESQLSAAWRAQESFPHSTCCSQSRWHKGSAEEGSDCSTLFSRWTVPHIATTTAPYVACRTATLYTSTRKKSEIHSGSLGFVFWTNSKAMERALYMYLLCDSQQLAGKRLKSPASMHGEASWLAKGWFQRAGGKQHCACIAMNLLEAEQMLWQSLFFAPGARRPS